MHFISEKRGFVAGDDGVLLSTDDGGETWTKYPLNTTENINEIYFRNDKDGYIVAGRLIFTTSDGGRTWQESRILSEADFKNGTPEFISIRFSDKKRGLAIGSLINKRDEIIDSIVMRTTDGGASWQRVIIPTKSELFHLDFNGNSHGWIVGDKTGTGGHGTVNDIAIVWPRRAADRPVIIASLINGAAASADINYKAHADLARAVAAAL